MQTKTCPDCGDDIAVTAKSHKCGWSQSSGKPGLSRLGELAEMAKQRFASEPAPELTPQQWYNVCKFFSIAAAHCKPKHGITLASVGPEHPLDRTSRRGPLMRQTEEELLPLGERE